MTLRLIFLIPFFLSGQMIEIDHFQDLEKYVSSDTLVVLDIDNTLLTTKQMFGSDIWFQHQCEKIRLETGGEAQEDYLPILNLWSALQCCSQFRQVEQEAADVIDKIQNRGISVMGLTLRSLCTADLTGTQLEFFGFDLAKTSPGKTDLYFTHGSHCILFRGGVLFAGLADQGEVFLEFLDRENLHPKRIVFVNDQHKYLESVARALETKNISFTGLRYKCLDQQVANYDPKVAEIQLRYSSLSHILSDDEAKSILDGGTQ